MNAFSGGQAQELRELRRVVNAQIRAAKDALMAL
jgi:hypothetical protein